MTTTLIEPTRIARESGVIEALVTALAGDPAARWVYPDGRHYLKCFPDFVRAFAGRALEQDSADAIEGLVTIGGVRSEARPDRQCICADAAHGAVNRQTTGAFPPARPVREWCPQRP
jgi:hypothetical protein